MSLHFNLSIYRQILVRDLSIEACLVRVCEAHLYFMQNKKFADKLPEIIGTVYIMADGASVWKVKNNRVLSGVCKWGTTIFKQYVLQNWKLF